MVLGLMDRLRRKDREEQAAERMTWRDLVADVARGAVHSEARAREVLALTGHTVGELDQAVGSHKERVALAARLEAIGDPRSRIVEIELRLQTIAREAAAQKQARDAECSALDTERAQLVSATCQQDSLRGQLRRLYADDDVLTHERDLCDRKQRLATRQRALRQRLSGGDASMVGVAANDSCGLQSARRDMQRLQRQRANVRGERQIAKHDVEIASAQAGIDKLTAAVKPLWDELHVVEAEMGTLDAELQNITAIKEQA